MSGVLCAQMGGLPNYTGSATVTVGFVKVGSSPTDVDFWGWVDLGATPGAISPSTWAGSGLTVADLDYRIVYNTGVTSVVFIVTGYAPNLGWNAMDVAGTNYVRSAASYSYNGTNTAWVWNAAATGNPFGTTIGATKAVVWS